MLTTRTYSEAESSTEGTFQGPDWKKQLGLYNWKYYIVT